MWSVERVSTRDPDPEKQIPASSFEFHSTNIYIYRVIRVELYKLYRVIIFFFRSLFEEEGEKYVSVSSEKTYINYYV